MKGLNLEKVVLYAGIAAVLGVAAYAFSRRHRRATPTPEQAAAEINVTRGASSMNQ